MPREKYQPQPRFESEPVDEELLIESQVPQSPGTGRTPKPMNSDPDAYVPAKVNQSECIARLREAGLSMNTDPTAYERILRIALALDSQTPITPELLGALWLSYMHEPVIEGSNVLSTAVVGYANRNRIGLPRPGIASNGHQVTFREEMARRCL